ncbi:MAG: ABC transporter permease [Gemmatimonadota bacterium]
MSPKPFRFFQFPWRSRGAIAREVDAELAFHIDARVTALQAEGLGADEARRQAEAEFGDLEFTRRYCRDLDERSERKIRLADRLAEWQQDAKYAWRTLRRSPGFAAVSILTLALGIGANTAIFSVARAVLLKPLPYREPGALVSLFERPIDKPDARWSLSAPNFADYRERQHTLSGVAAYYQRLATWRVGSSDPEIVIAMRVTANLFDVLGVPAWRGRTFTAGDDAASASSKVILSFKFWQHDLGADSAIVGRTITLYNQAYTVVGVMPRGFAVTGEESMWIPLDLSDDLARAAITRKQRFFNTVARLKPGVTFETARADLFGISRRLQTEYPEANSGYLSSLVPLHETMAANLKQPVLLLLGAAALILLIACANLANVTLSRSVSRSGEMAVRAALGAGRGRLARQLLTESVLLSVAGGGLGVMLAMVATRALLALNPTTLGGVFEVGIDGRVLLFSALVSVGTGVLFGLAPAIAAARSDLHGALKDRGRGGTGGHAGERLRHGLVVAQMGLAVMLLIGAGLLVRSFREITNVDLGYDPDHVLTAQLRVDGARYDSAAAVNQFYDGVLAEIARAPGVVATGAAMYAPAQGKEYSTMFVEGSGTDPARLPSIAYNMVRGDYFKALKIPIVAGRTYNESDTPAGPEVAIINEAAAHRFFPKGDAVGRHVRVGPNPNVPWKTIVGVVGDMRDAANWVAPEPTIYDNSRQQTWWGSLSVVVRTTGDPESAVPLLRRAVKAGDPTLALRDVATLDQVIGTSLAGRRFALGLAASFAGLALLLAAIGIYGVLAYSVTSRTREFGVRLALGAPRQSVLMLVLRQGLGWSLIGLAVGVGGALAGGRLLAGMLYGVQPIDLATYLTVAAGLLIVVTIACLVPAARATSVDPLTSTRAE